MNSKLLGVLIFSLILIILAIYNGISLFSAFILVEDITRKPGFIGLTILQLAKTVIFFIIGFGLLKFKWWARTFAMFLFSFYIVVSVFIVLMSFGEKTFLATIYDLIPQCIFFFLSVLILWYFSRGSIKKLFRKESGLNIQENQ